MKISSSGDLNAQLGSLFDTLRLPASRTPRVHLPLKDDVGTGVVVPVTWSCFDDDMLLGVVGLDIQLSDVVQDVTYFMSSDSNAYAFMMDVNGLCSPSSRNLRHMEMLHV